MEKVVQMDNNSMMICLYMIILLFPRDFSIYASSMYQYQLKRYQRYYEKIPSRLCIGILLFYALKQWLMNYTLAAYVVLYDCLFRYLIVVGRP